MTHVFADNYTDWLYEVSETWISKCSAKSYHRAIVRLDHALFKSDIPRDKNRIDDAVTLWKTTTGMTEDTLAEASILEVMISLALRCENEIMHDPRLGDQTHLWFWMMFHSLGLEPFDDDNYDPKAINDIIEKLNRRRYFRNGKGGLFAVYSHPEIDMRKTEVWYQMQLALCEYLGM